MIFTRINPNTPFYRALTPKWAFQPESGAGAAERGGRFNRPGVEARYLGGSPQVALLEYQAESVLLPPAIVACYLVSAEPVVDFTGGYDSRSWSPLWREAFCNWKNLAYLQRVDPPSWDIGDLVRESGACGLLYRSARDVRETNLVLYPECAHLFTAPVYDPDGRLPRDDRSWRP
jgi:RES domain-containing protein